MKRITLLLGVSLLLLTTVAPVSAVDAADYVAWRVWKPGHRAILTVADVNGDGRIDAAINGLQPNHDYRIVGTNANGSCSHRASASNRTFVIDVNADFLGNVFVAATANGGVWKTTNFVRVKEVGGATWACARTMSYAVGPNVHDNAVASFEFGDGSVRAIALVQQTSNTQARVSVAVGFINSDDPVDVTLRGVTARCGRQGSTVLSLVLKDVLVSSFKTRVVALTPNELNSLKSFRIKAPDSDPETTWLPACRKSVLIALLVP